MSLTSPVGKVSNRRLPKSELSQDMIPIPGGTFRMGSDQHYPEEAPAHHVTVTS